MVTKRVSTGKKATRKKATNGDGATEHANGAALSNGESAQPVKSHATNLDPDVHRQLVAAEAYFRAERRGFAAGRELEDWVAAEKAVALRFEQAQVA